jgi:putative ABC transport system ATP-binding protein
VTAGLPVLLGIGLTHRFDAITVLRGADIAVRRGEVVMASAASRPLLQAVTTIAAREDGL